jgi:uncharacterized membrane protein YbhN (UPF0104 family)
MTDARRFVRAIRSRPAWTWGKAMAGLGILALLAWRVGLGPFVDGLRNVNAWSIAVAAGLGLLATAACAFRWRIVAHGLGVGLTMREALSAYYRALFLNVTLPGGVAGDVHRAVRHGAAIGDVGLGVRAVLLERLAGQTVMAVIAGVILVALPSPIRTPLLGASLAVTSILAAVLIAMWAFGRGLRRRRSWRWLSRVDTVWAEVRHGLFTPRTVVGVIVASAVVVASNAAVFVLAARTAGSTAPVSVLVPLAILALLAMSVPLNVAGWGPREGVTAWAFGLAGLTVAEGVATAVTYGLLMLAACLPGAAVLVLRRAGRAPRPAAALAPGDRRG